MIRLSIKNIEKLSYVVSQQFLLEDMESIY